MTDQLLSLICYGSDISPKRRISEHSPFKTQNPILVFVFHFFVFRYVANAETDSVANAVANPVANGIIHISEKDQQVDRVAQLV
jgi:hypothetical protein